MRSTAGVNLSHKETEVLKCAKEANPSWFQALLKASEIQAERRAKYSGDGNPYTNFIIVSALFRMKHPEITDEDIFYFYQCLKLARLIVSAEDFDDEKVEDTLIDLANYALLEVGFRCQKSDAQEQDLQIQLPWKTV